jgi:hypothetical protein
MAIKKTLEQFLLDARAAHGDRYDYSNIKIYYNDATKVEIVCSIHGSFFQTPHSHISGHGCPECAKKSNTNTLESFLESSKRIHNNFYDYSKVTEYKNSYTKVEIICPTHGSFWQKPAPHLRGVGCKKCASDARKKTLKGFIEECIKLHANKFDYSKITEYVNAFTKVEIVCPIHGSFWQTPNDHLRGDGGCLSCSLEKRRNTLEYFIQKSNEVHNNFYDYSRITEYKGGESKLEIVCPNHGPFWQLAKNHMNSGQGCLKCAIEEATFTTEYFVQKAKEVHGDLYDYSKITEYKNSYTKVKIICHQHGEFLQNPAEHLRGSKCPDCVIKEKTHTFQSFLDRSNLVHKNIYDYSKITEYVNISTKVEIVCAKHGSFWQRPFDHVNGSGCPRCSKSVSIKETAWLDYLGVPDLTETHRQVKIKIGNKKYVIDGYDPQTNTVYEFHGDYWHGNLNIYQPDELNQVTGKSMQYHYDQTCRKHRDIKGAGYNLVWIWESDWKKQVAVQKMFKGAA